MAARQYIATGSATPLYYNDVTTTQVLTPPPLFINGGGSAAFVPPGQGKKGGKPPRPKPPPPGPTPSSYNPFSLLPATPASSILAVPLSFRKAPVQYRRLATSLNSLFGMGSSTGVATVTGISAFVGSALGAATVTGSIFVAYLGSVVGTATVKGIGIAMPSSLPNKFNSFDANLSNGGINLGSDTLKILLTNTSPVATNQVYADVQGIEIAGGNGYTTGGNVATRISSSQTGGFYTLVLGNWVLNAGGNVGPFRFLVLYSTNTSLVAQPLMVWWDYGSPLTLTEGGTFTIGFDPILGAINMQ